MSRLRAEANISALLSARAPAAEPTGAEREIRRRIADSGGIPFAEFMEIALYYPDGYYARRGRIGADGDYFTSPTAHPAFGALLAMQMFAMWRALGCPSPFWIVECGAGDGILAADLMEFAERHLPDFARAARYIAIDRMPSRARPSTPVGVSWAASTGLPLRGVVGCVVSNELIDAFPVHRFQIEGGRPLEVFVAAGADDSFEERLREPTTPLIAERIAPMLARLPDGYRGEVNAGIDDWTASAAAALDRGFALTIDYGDEAGELYSPRRAAGTLQTHYRHTAGGSPYQRVGRQDITARVDFSALIESGRAVGLAPVFLTTQAELLTSLGIRRMESYIASAGLDRATELANLRAIRRIAAPDGLGAFRALVQEKDSGISRSMDLDAPACVIERLSAPMLGARHLPPSPQDGGTALESLWHSSAE